MTAYRPPEAISILGVPVHVVTQAEVLRLVEAFMTEPRLHQLVTANPEFVMRAQRDEAFCRVLKGADLSVPDGVGLLYAARLLGHRLPQRVAGSDLVYDLAAAAARAGWRLFLLGAREGVAAAAAKALQARYPALQVAGAYPGSPTLAENDALVERINASRADLLFVAYGAPQQDLWIARNQPALATVRVAMGVGGSLDFVAGRARRAPRGWQASGLEWLYRLGQEPWRWRRMLALPHFAIRVLLSRWQGPRRA